MFNHTVGTVYLHVTDPSPRIQDMVAVLPGQQMVLDDIRLARHHDNYACTQEGLFSDQWLPLPIMHDKPLHQPMVYIDPDHHIVLPGQDNVPNNLKQTGSLQIVCELLYPCAPYPCYAARTIWQPAGADYPWLFTVFAEPEEIGGGCFTTSIPHAAEHTAVEGYYPIPREVLELYAESGE